MSIQTGLIAESFTPSWVKILEWFASLPGILSLLALGLIVFLKWIGEI
ncbi:MAG: hypothetical protein GW865_03850 [Candidatus Aenigmarchaeota archaeon]|nr:hypothetical protein [Candidatus Aenigmarchaeota archaeon]